MDNDKEIKGAQSSNHNERNCGYSRIMVGLYLVFGCLAFIVVILAVHSFSKMKIGERRDKLLVDMMWTTISVLDEESIEEVKVYREDETEPLKTIQEREKVASFVSALQDSRKGEPGDPFCGEELYVLVHLIKGKRLEYKICPASDGVAYFDFVKTRNNRKATSHFGNARSKALYAWLQDNVLSPSDG